MFGAASDQSASGTGVADSARRTDAGSSGARPFAQIHSLKNLDPTPDRSRGLGQRFPIGVPTACSVNPRAIVRAMAMNVIRNRYGHRRSCVRLRDAASRRAAPLDPIGAVRTQVRALEDVGAIQTIPRGARKYSFGPFASDRGVAPGSGLT